MPDIFFAPEHCRHGQVSFTSQASCGVRWQVHNFQYCSSVILYWLDLPSPNLLDGEANLDEFSEVFMFYRYVHQVILLLMIDEAVRCCIDCCIIALNTSESNSFM